MTVTEESWDEEGPDPFVECTHSIRDTRLSPRKTMRPDFQISTIREALDTDTKPHSFRAALQEIQDGRWAVAVEDVRQAYQRGLQSDSSDPEKAGKDAAAPAKKKLPGYLFSGTFTRRAKEALIEQSGLICVDLDKLGDRVEATRDLIAQDPHTLAAFISPTGTGLKVVFRCDPKKDHYLSFRAAGEYVLKHFGLEIDEACKDVNRICFVSHDPDLFAADDAEVLPYPEPVKEFHVPLDKPRTGTPETTPGDDYDSRGDVFAVLRSYGWSQIGKNGWRRPDKTDGVSATFDKVPGRFYCFSSSTQFQANHVYKPWHVYAILECGGDFKEAARRLGRNGYGAQQGMTYEPIRNDGAMSVIGGAWDDTPSTPINIIPGVKKETVQRLPSSFLLEPDNDASVLLGNRFLNRGDGGILVGSSGMGKSSASIQMAVSWSLGLPFQGIKSNGPLKILIIQSEDSDGDIAEVMLSMRHMMKLTAGQIGQVDQNVRIVCDRVNRGGAFIASLKSHLSEFSPDLVIINPLQAFIDGDVTESRDLGQFLRGGLNGLNDNKFGYLLVHHTTKPATGRDRGERQWHEVMYDMAGGAELINWARFVISLRAAKTNTPGDFDLVLAKRGRRANVTAITGEAPFIKEEIITSIPVRHSTGSIEVPGRRRPVSIIFWEPREKTEEEKPAVKGVGGRPEKYPFSNWSSVFPENNTPGLPVAQLLTKLRLNGSIGDKSIHGVLARWMDHDNAIEFTHDRNGVKLWRKSV